MDHEAAAFLEPLQYAAVRLFHGLGDPEGQVDLRRPDLDPTEPSDEPDDAALGVRLLQSPCLIEDQATKRLTVRLNEAPGQHDDAGRIITPGAQAGRAARTHCILPQGQRTPLPATIQTD